MKHLRGLFTLASASIQTVFFCIQLVFTIIFFKRTKEIKEVGRTPKRLVICGNFTSVGFIIWTSSKAIGLLNDSKSIDKYILPFLFVFAWLPLGYITIQWMKLLAIQVQLRTRNENTNSIYKRMKRSRRFNIFIITFVCIAVVTVGISYVIYDSRSSTFAVVRLIGMLQVFSVMLIYSNDLRTTFKGFFLFLKEQGDTSNPTKITNAVLNFWVVVLSLILLIYSAAQVFWILQVARHDD